MVVDSIEWILHHEESYRYQMLGRLQADCEYYLGFGSRDTERLWSKNVTDQIAMMKAIWNSFPDDGKPVWLTLEQIEQYATDMLVSSQTILDDCTAAGSTE